MTNAAQFKTHWLTKTLAPFQQFNLWNSALKEFLGSNVPHLLLAVWPGEFWDQFINQIGNTLSSVGVGLSVDVLSTKLLKGLNAEKFNQGLSKNAQECYNLGKAFIVFPVIGAFSLASPLLRNTIMSHVTKKDNFVEIAGVKGSTASGSENQPETEGHKKNRIAKEHENMTKFSTIMALGLLTSATSIAITHHAIATNKVLPAWTKKTFGLPFTKQRFSFNSLFALKEGKYLNVTDAGICLSWALPAYVGLLAASRDTVELTENMARTLWFGFAFVIAPRSIEKPLENFFKTKENKLWGTGQNLAYLTQIAVGSVIYAGMPTVMNRVFRHRRAEKAGLIPASKPTVQPPTPFVPPTRTTPLPMSTNPYPSVGFYQASVMAGI